MADKTTIEWAEATWNPITGCKVLSPGCRDCYAMKLAGGRLKNHPSRAGLTRMTKNGPVWTGEVRFNSRWMNDPYKWASPRRIFVVAHGDLFYEAVPADWIADIWEVMEDNPRHIFLVLTKRPERMLFLRRGKAAPSHIWLGFSAEDQPRFDERWDSVRQLAAMGWNTWVSAEPLLQGIDMASALTRNFRLRWVVAGHLSGRHAHKKPDPVHMRLIRDQCVRANVPFLMKQWGGPTSKSWGRELDGRTWDETPWTPA